MTETLARDELYDLVWTTPLRLLAPRFGVSDVALRKACQKASIPTPDRGYWAKLEAGKPVVKAALPLRPPGMAQDVPVGGGGQRHWYRPWSRDELLAPIPAAPQFEESLEALRARIEAGLGKVAVGAKAPWHLGIQRLLTQDEARRTKAAASDYVFSWEQPVFDSAFERRRLQVLNVLLAAVGRFDGKANIRGRDARDLSITFHQQHVGIALERAKPTGKAAGPKSADRLCLSILKGLGSAESRATWSDGDETRLEQQLTTIAAEIVLTAEVRLREDAVRRHQWRIDRKAALEEEDRQRVIEQARLERERLERLEQARIAALLKAADDFRRAQEIRAYVAALGETLDPSDTGRWTDYEVWASWARRQADRIDPALKATFCEPVEEA